MGEKVGALSSDATLQDGMRGEDQCFPADGRLSSPFEPLVIAKGLQIIEVPTSVADLGAMYRSFTELMCRS